MYCTKGLLSAVRRRQLQTEGEILNGLNNNYLEIREFSVLDLEGNPVSDIIEGQSYVIVAGAEFKCTRVVHVEFNPAFYHGGIVSARVIMAVLEAPQMRFEALRDVDTQQLQYFCRLYIAE